jgi:hypothetical protein
MLYKRYGTTLERKGRKKTSRNLGQIFDEGKLVLSNGKRKMDSRQKKIFPVTEKMKR